MDKTAALASDILLGIGGEKNIQRLENCMTRVRVEVHNDEKLDLTRLKQLPGVSGYVKQGQQHQLIVGPGKAAQVVDAMRALMTGGETAPTFDDAERTKAQAKAKYKAPMSDALRQLANVFIPLIPAFIASGLITGIINILKRPDIVGNFATQYPNLLGILAIFGSAVFAIMNILVGVNTAKVFGGSLAMRNGGYPLQPAAGADYAVWRGASAWPRWGDCRAAGGHSDVLDREKAARGAARLD